MTLDMEADCRQNIIENFSLHAGSYCRHALVQKESARLLFQEIERVWTNELADGNILELGCGTGELSALLIHLPRKGAITFSDASAEMLVAAKEKLTASAPEKVSAVEFLMLDARQLPSQSQYSLIASSFVLQWLGDPLLSVAAQIEALKPGGVLAIAFPSSRSFPEWRNLCQNLNLPFTGNALPDTDRIVELLNRSRCQYSVASHQFEETFPTARHFFESLKKVGASTSLAGTSLSYLPFKSLLRSWDSACGSQIVVTYEIAQIICEKKE